MSRIYSKKGSISQKDLISVVNALREGGVIILPTETLYGFSADAENYETLLRIRRFKGREHNIPFLLLAQNMEMVRRYADVLDERVVNFLNRCWPGPVSVLLHASHRAPSFTTSPEGKIGIRVPPEGIASAVCAELDGLVVSTSVNRSGESPLIAPEEIWKRFGADVEFMIDAGELTRTTPSSIVDLTVDPPLIHRAGAVSRSIIEEALGEYW